MDRDSDIPPDPQDSIRANPAMVDRLIRGIGVGIQGSIIPGQTSQADLLSAMLTVMYRMLQNAQENEEPAAQGKNASEIGIVLADMLLAFGPTTEVN